MEQTWRWFGPEDVIHLPLVRQAGVTSSSIKRRHDSGDADWRIPFRPDHGHELLDGMGKAACAAWLTAIAGLNPNKTRLKQLGGITK